MLKKVLIGLLVFFIVIVGALALTPLLFKDKLVAIAKNEINKSINAKVNFDDVSVSLFKSFPKLHFGLKDLDISGVGKFEGVSLAQVDELSAGINLMKYIREQKIEINSIEIDQPIINAVVLKDSSANYDIMKPTEEKEEAAKPFNLDLQKLAINDARISYKDEVSETVARFAGLNIDGSGNFSSDQFKATTALEADSAYVSMGGTNYLNNSRVSLDANTDIDLKNKVYQIIENTIGINDLKLETKGKVDQSKGNTNLDLSFATKDNDLKAFLSLLPSSIVQDLGDIKTDGIFSLDGKIKGVLDSTHIPGFDVNLLVKDGKIQYKGLPKAITNLGIDMNASNATGNVDLTKINLKHLNAKLGDYPISAQGTVEGLTKMLINATANAKVDLGDVQSFYPLKDQKLDGTLVLNGKANGIYDKAAGLYPKVNAIFNIANGYYENKAYNAQLKNILADASLINTTGLIKDSRFELKNLTASLDNEPVSAKALVYNLADPNFDIALKGKANIEKWLKVFPIEGTDMKGKLNLDVTAKGKQSDIDNKQYQNIATNGVASLSGFTYKSANLPATVNMPQANVKFTPSSIVVEKAQGTIGKSDFNINGNVENYWAYVLKKNEPLEGNINLTSNKIDVNEFKTPPTGNTSKKSSAPKEEEVVLVPENLNMNIQTKIGELLYDNLRLTNFAGKVNINDQKLTLSDVGANLLGGSTVINGSYSTKNPYQPDINLNYNIKDWNLKQTFETFNTIQKIAPISKFISGTFSSSMGLDGKLGKDMNPILNSLTGEGLALVLRGELDKSFKPYMELLNKVNVPQLEKLDLSNLEAKFSFKNGRVNVQPFDFAVKDTKMNIEGSHGFDNTMDYIVHMAVPRGKFGGEMKSFIDAQFKHLETIGVKYDENAPIKFDVLIKGTLTNPVVTTNIKDVMKAFGQDLKNQAIDKGKEVVKDQIKQGLDKLPINIPGSKPNNNSQPANNQQPANNTTPTDTNATKPTPAPAPKEQVKTQGKNLLDKLLKPK
ncbi:MAG: AsmA family protein [Chitinophagales bacterium]|nr:AsmA family protein [Chitinophagales bacterium]